MQQAQQKEAFHWEDFPSLLWFLLCVLLKQTTLEAVGALAALERGQQPTLQLRETMRAISPLFLWFGLFFFWS